MVFSECCSILWPLERPRGGRTGQPGADMKKGSLGIMTDSLPMKSLFYYVSLLQQFSLKQFLPGNRWF